jgi:hypothetical protein
VVEEIRVRTATALAIVAAALSLAAAPGHHPVPLPQPNPFRTHAAETPAKPPAAPRSRPARQESAKPPPAKPAAQPQEKAKRPPDRDNIVVTAAAACQGRLRRLGVRFTPKPPVKDGQCAIPAPVEVSRLAEGVAVKPPALLGCAEAERLARWVAEAVTPAADAAFHAKPTLIGQASAYVCRTRDHIAGARISEHAFGNALDIARIGFADRPPVEIGKPKGPVEKAFAERIRRAACDYFTTVLGPGDAYHDTHFHLDRENRRSGYRLCE